MKLIAPTCFLISLLFLVSSLQAQSTWTMAQITQAHREGRYEELMFRILDVAPNQRDEDWARAYKGCVKYQIRNSRGMLNPEALRAMRDLLPHSELDSEFQYDTAKFLYQTTRSATSAIPWYADAITTRNEVRLCRDQDLHQAVVSVLRYETGDEVKDARKLMIICIDEVLPALKSVVADEGLVFFQNVCSPLKQQIASSDYQDFFAERCKEHGF
jgi:hypothetical protein